MSTYAHDTKVPVSRSRSEITKLLRRWKCDAIQWTDDDRTRVVTLRFRWSFEDVDYAARIQLRLPSDRDLAGESHRRPTAVQLQRRRSLHRVLLLTIKAQFVAVDAGLITAVEAFLPHLETREGATVAELVIPRLRLLTEEGGGRRLLEGPA